MLLIFGAFSWYPIVRTVIMSLQHTNLVSPATWVGLDNFRTVLHDPLLPMAVENTAEFAGLALIFGYPMPLVAAVLMSEVRRFRGVYSALAYLPVVIPPVVAVLLWKTFYDASPTGVFNTILGWIHLGPYPWLQSQQTALPSLVLESTWANAGGTVIIYLAALTGVNRELYEAASVDGASLWRKVWHITLPQLRGVLLLTMILQIIGTAQVFLEPYLFTSGGPANSTLTVLLLIYNYAFGNSLGGDYGNATALSLMLAGVPRGLLAGVPARDALVEHRMMVLGRRRRAPSVEGSGPALIGPDEWRRPGIRWGFGFAQTLLLIGLVVVGLGPLLWLAKSAITPTNDTISHPMALFPHGAAWSNLSRAWNDVDVGRYFWNTIVLAIGSWVTQIVVATTGGFALSVLRPKYAKRDHRAPAHDAVRSRGRAARAALRRDRAPAADPPLVHRQLLGGLAAGRCERVQRRAREAVLRQPAARDLRGGADRRRRPVPPVLVDRAADVAADPRRRLGVRGARVVEGLPLAAARAHESERAAALGAPADDPVADGARRLPRRAVHRSASCRSSAS